MTWERVFYALPDKCVVRTDARMRRAVNFWLLILWLGPGLALWLTLRDALWFVGFMSVYAIWVSHFGAFSAETPVEAE